MQALSRSAYDQAYIKDMLKDHKQDLSEFHTEASNGHDSSIRDAARQGSKTISEHLQMAEQLAKEQSVNIPVGPRVLSVQRSLHREDPWRPLPFRNTNGLLCFV